MGVKERVTNLKIVGTTSRVWSALFKVKNDQ